MLGIVQERECFQEINTERRCFHGTYKRNHIRPVLHRIRSYPKI